MSAQDDLKTAQAALTSLETELSSPAVPSVGDSLLETLVNALTAAGYTVTPPAVVTTEAETLAADTTDTTEATS